MKMACILLSLASLCGIYLEWPPAEPQIIFCDVGQGDAILLTHGFTQYLVDAGPDDQVLECLGRYTPFWDRTIEFVVVTHADADHIGGIGAVLDRFSTPVLMLRTTGKNTDDFTAFYTSLSRKISAKKTQVLIPQSGQHTAISSSIRVTTLLTPSTTPGSQMGFLDESETELWDKKMQELSKLPAKEDQNNGSIVLYVDIENTRVLLTGDLEMLGEQALLERGMITPAHILKVGHHGSKTSSSLPFLERVSPETAVLSAGFQNQFQHPSPQVVSHLHEVGAQVFRTDLQGDIRITVSSSGYTVHPSRESVLLRN